MYKLSKQNLFYNFLIWTIVALFTGTQLYLKSIQAGGEQSWWTFLKVQLYVWWVWGIITPFVFWLGNRFRVDKWSVLKIVLIHLPIAVCIVCFYLALYTLIWNLETGASISWEGFSGLFVVLFMNLFHWHFFIYMGIIGVVHAHSYFTESKERAVKSIRLEKELLQSRLNFLKMQLQPHFLFNTLNGIVSAIHQDKPEAAANMTTELSELLRISLAGTEQQITTLRQELHHLNSYLNIEKFRFKDLIIKNHIPDTILDIEVPSFFLQPIVENAIKHGISKQAAARIIELSLEEEEAYLRFKVYNEGPPPEKNKEGIGLSNVRKRLNALFGAAGKLQIMPHLEGTLVTIEIPRA